MACDAQRKVNQPADHGKHNGEINVENQEAKNEALVGGSALNAGLGGISQEKEMDGRILTCVYCGHEYPQDTPAHGSQVLTEHIKVCEQHPMRKAEADIALLRSALAGLIGADTADELRQMEAVMRLLPAPDSDKAVLINAIHVLMATLTPNVELTGAAPTKHGEHNER